MRPTRLRVLATVVVVTVVVGLVVLRALRSSGHPMPQVPWTAPIGLLIVAALVYSAAVPVGRMTKGRSGARPVHPLRAARVAVLGKATAYAGSVVLGWYVAQVVFLAPDLDISTRRNQLVRAAVAGVAALAVAIAGLLAERMCRVPPDPTEGAAGRPTGRGVPEDDADVTGEVGRHG